MIALKTARYGGVEFAFVDATTSGGNRLVKFNYPGSDKQSIERQGKMPRTFNMTAVIPHDDYEQKRDDLLRVLEDGSTKTLTHPTFGDIENVVSGVFSISERISELGRAEIRMTFEVNDAIGVPVETGASTAQVKAASDALNVVLDYDLQNEFSVDSNAPGNFIDAFLALDNISEAMSSISEFANPLLEGVSRFRQSIRGFSGAIGGLINTPAAMAAEIRGMMEDVDNLFDAPSSLFGAFRLLFSFGDDDPVINTTTVGLTERKRNRDLLRTHVRVSALSLSYIAATEIEYETTEDLESVRSELESQYVDARNNQLLSSDASDALNNLRVRALKTLDQVRLNTRTIITINTPLRPLSILVYAYYGSTELTETIANLNNIKQSAFVEGNIKILTS